MLSLPSIITINTQLPIRARTYQAIELISDKMHEKQGYLRELNADSGET